MTHHHGHHSLGFGALAIVAAIAFAFGPRVARIVVGSVLIGVPLAVALFIAVYGI